MAKIKEFYNIKDINKQIENNPLKLILDAESSYRGQLFKVAKKILSSNSKIVLVAGPSCAGKTTSALLIKQILERFKKHIITISMDDFFLNREQTPKLPNGSNDYDSIFALNLQQMEECFTQLLQSGKAKFPRFDFIDGINYADVFEYELKKNTIILFEGLHVLNPELTKRLGTSKLFKIFLSPITGFEYDNLFLSSRNLRLVRRMVRDVERRGHSPEATLKIWDDVCAAEDVYIEPYKKDVNFVINTTHTYEVAVFKKELYGLLFNHNEVIRALDFISLFDTSSSLNKALLPQTSLMWEFIEKP